MMHGLISSRTQKRKRGRPAVNYKHCLTEALERFDLAYLDVETMSWRVWLTKLNGSGLTSAMDTAEWLADMHRQPPIAETQNMDDMDELDMGDRVIMEPVLNIPEVLSGGQIPPLLQEAVVAKTRIQIHSATDENRTNATRNAILTAFEDILEVAALLQATRNLNPRQIVPKTNGLLFIFWDYLPAEFRQIVKRERVPFIRIAAKIGGHPVSTNNSSVPQEKVWIQLFVAINRLGCEGNGASIGRNAKFFGIGHGTVHLYTNRVITALLSFKDVVIR